MTAYITITRPAYLMNGNINPEDIPVCEFTTPASGVNIIENYGAAVAKMINKGMRIDCAMFSNALFRYITFRNVDFSDTKFSGCGFECCHFENCTFERTTLYSCNFVGCAFTHPVWNLHMHETQFYDTDIKLLHPDLCTARNVYGCDYIKSLSVDKWDIAYTENTLRIGCQKHSIERWKTWRDNKSWIDMMDQTRALYWAEQHLDGLLAFIEQFPALPAYTEEK